MPTQTWQFISSSLPSPRWVPLPVFLVFAHGFLCIKAGNLTAVFDFPNFPIVSLIDSFSLSGYQKCCLYPSHTSQRYFLAQILTDSTSPIVHLFLTPSFIVLPHWIFLSMIHRWDHGTSLLTISKPSGLHIDCRINSSFFPRAFKGSTIWPQPVSNLPPPWKYYMLKLYQTISFPSTLLYFHVFVLLSMWRCPAKMSLSLESLLGEFLLWFSG